MIPRAGSDASERPSQAAEHRTAGVRDLVFRSLFKGLVYPQIWEDPEVDLEALQITPDCEVAAIASGGCNVLSYLIADPARITALDLSRAHVALNRLKIAAAQHLPSADAFYRFIGEADDKANIDLYWRYLAAHLDAETRAYWEGRSVFRLGRRRISLFERNVYRHGVLGRFIGFAHALARLYGVDLRDVLKAQTLAEQRTFFETALAPLFDKRLIRWMAENPVSLYGLGIPVAQHHALASVAAGDITSVLRGRMERLTCGFSLDENYFAWQAFGRSYAGGSGPVPPYLRRQHFDIVRERAHRIDVRNMAYRDFLQSRSDASLDRYVLLDAQDWLNDAELNALWREITRTAKPGARVIFRTAAEASLLPGRLDPALLARWRYEAELSHTLTQRDRSAIYGGFHLYVLEA